MKRQLNIFKVISCLAVLALVMIIAVGSTFSWYNRSISNTVQANDDLKYSVSGARINGCNATATTYTGTCNNGEFTFSDTAWDGTSDITVPTNGVVFFKTNVKNANTGKSVVSLYFEDFAYSNALGSAFHVGLISPEKTFKGESKTATTSDYEFDWVCLEDNIVLNANESVDVYWYISFDGMSLTSDNTINPGKIHLDYN